METERFIHVVAFNVPYPPNYGGIIDIYYKLEALRKEGLKIILHTYLYDRTRATELDDICHKVFYYRRHSGIVYMLKKLPYIVVVIDELAVF